MDETDLIAAARSGDAGSYEELVRRNQAIAFRTAYLVTGGGADAEDAAQAGFVKAFYALPRFRDGDPFRPWLLRIVTNEARNIVRSRGRSEGLRLRLVQGRPPSDAAPSVEGAALAEADRRVLVDALDALGDKDRLVVSYRYLLELSEAETAAALGIARGTVKSRLHRALKRLKKSLEASAETGGER